MHEPQEISKHCRGCRQPVGRLVVRGGVLLFEAPIGASVIACRWFVRVRCSCGRPFVWWHDGMTRKDAAVAALFLEKVETAELVQLARPQPLDN